MNDLFSFRDNKTAVTSEAGNTDSDARQKVKEEDKKNLREALANRKPDDEERILERVPWENPPVSGEKDPSPAEQNQQLQTEPSMLELMKQQIRETITRELQQAQLKRDRGLER